MLQERQGNIWDAHEEDDIAIIAVTTNSTVKKGYNVMGGGIAKEAASRFPAMSNELAKLLHIYGNKPFPFYAYRLITFPTKNSVWEDSTLDLVTESSAFIRRQWDKVADLSSVNLHIPRPGCGLGGLDWTDVEPIMEKYFGNDERFTIWSY